MGVILTWSLRATPEVQVTTAPLTVGSIARRIVTTGTIQAVTTVEVGSQVSGTIQALGADYNSTVRAGQVLARIDPATYDADLREAQGALALAQADADRARTTVMDAGTKLGVRRCSLNVSSFPGRIWMPRKPSSSRRMRACWRRKLKLSKPNAPLNKPTRISITP